MKMAPGEKKRKGTRGNVLVLATVPIASEACKKVRLVV